MKKTLLHICLIIGILGSTQLYSAQDKYDPSASVFRFQKKMAERGDLTSQFKLGLMYETGSGVAQNQEIATSWYKKASEKGYKPAQNRLTYLDIKKSGFREKHSKWLKNLKNDARFNEGEALFLLGQMYSEGTGVNKSLTSSLKLLRKAAAANIPGSESEIIRVEDELNQLQNKYLTQEEKKTIKKKATPAKKVKPKSTARKPVKQSPPVKKRLVTTRPASNTQTRLKPKPVARIKATNKPASKAVTRTRSKAATTQPTKTVKKIQPAIPPEQKDEEIHPMDRICGGRNQFLSGCR